jgi:ParB family chromosome partitioning protein
MTMTAGKTAVAQSAVAQPGVDRAGTESQGIGKTAAPPATGDRVASDKVASPVSGGVPADKPIADRPALAHDRRRALGRGLESLLPGPRPMPAAPGGVVAGGAVPGGAVGTGVGPAAHAGAAPGAGTPLASDAPSPATIPDPQAQSTRKLAEGYEVIELALDLIDKNPYQTRKIRRDDEDDEALFELSESIRVNGVIQPITVRRGKNGRYILVAGERRVEASRTAQKKTIPAIVRTVSEQQAAEITVIENLQRADLNCMEQALAYIVLSQDFGLTQEQIGQRVGVSRESVSNYMRLAKLPEKTQDYLIRGQLEFSHARVLLNLKDPNVIDKLAHKAATENWSVDKLENFVLLDPSMFPGQKAASTGGGARWVDPNVRAAQRELERILGVKVKIRDRKGKGKITLEYATLEDFDRVLEMLTGKSKKSSGEM